MARQRKKLIRLIPVLDFGGVESRFVLQSSLMDQEKFEMRVCTFWKEGDAARRVRALGVPVDVLGVDPALRNPKALWALWRYLMVQRPDIVHASVGEAMFHGAIASFLAGVPRRLIEDTGIPSRSPLGRRIYGLLGHLVDHVVGVSAATCRYLLEEDKMPADRVKLVYNCGRPELFGPERRALDPTLGERPLRLLAVGRLVEVKNQAMIIEAMSRLVHRDGVKVTLSIAGDGALRGDLQRAIEERDLSDHVTMLGFRDDVPELLKRHDVFVLPSFTEGCSIALIEAMATGLIPLGSRADGVLEVMDGLQRYDLNLPADDIEAWVKRITQLTLLKPETIWEIGERARQLAYERFSPERYISELEELYLG